MDDHSYTFPEVAVRMIQLPPRQEYPPINTAPKAVEYVSALIDTCTVEHLLVIMLDTRLKPLCYSVIGIGTIDHACFSTAEIVRIALLNNTAGVIVLHNHPNGDPSPSRDDDAAANRISEALRLFDISLHDFIIVSQDEIFSYSEQGHGPFI